MVTGGAGFVGSHLALSFKRDMPDATVIALDNLKLRGSELALRRLALGGVESRRGDIHTSEDLADVGSLDLLIECSAEPSVQAGLVGDNRYLINTNLVGTINCLDHARRHGAAVVFLSTSRVYRSHCSATCRWLPPRHDLSSSRQIPDRDGRPADR
jgi:CDP-paratose 2-epimerase